MMEEKLLVRMASVALKAVVFGGIVRGLGIAPALHASCVAAVCRCKLSRTCIQLCLCCRGACQTLGTGVLGSWQVGQLPQRTPPPLLSRHSPRVALPGGGGRDFTTHPLCVGSHRLLAVVVPSRMVAVVLVQCFALTGLPCVVSPPPHPSTNASSYNATSGSWTKWSCGSKTWL